MNAKIVTENGQKVGRGRYTGVVWSYNNYLWMVLNVKDKFAYAWGPLSEASRLRPL